MASGPRAITVPLSAPAATVAFQLPPNVTLDVQAVYVDIDATAGQADPELVVSAPSGVVIARKRQSGSVAAGGVGSATWALRLTDETGSAAAADEPWAVVAAALNTAIVNGSSTQPLFNLTTNDPTAFSLTGGFPTLLQFDKAGTYAIYGAFSAISNPLAPIANPWTTFLQAGPTVSPGTTFFQLPPGRTVPGSSGQTWNGEWVTVTRVSQAQVGGQLGWAWNNTTGATLPVAYGGYYVQRIGA